MNPSEIVKASIQFILAGAVAVAFLYLVFERIIGPNEVIPVLTLTFGFFFGRKVAK